VNAGLECRTVFNHIHKLPTLALWSVNRAQESR